MSKLNVKDTDDNFLHFSEVVDLESLASRVYRSIVQREFLETRHNTVEDDGLVGLLNLMSNILKHDPSFKTGKEGQDLLNEVTILF